MGGHRRCFFCSFGFPGRFAFGLFPPGFGVWFGKPWKFGWGFPSREEYRAMLEDYKRELEGYRRELDEELKRVEEELARLGKE
ncbi:MAG: hypothetical protein NUW06_00870 [Candidatus Acetothermia bacterium]|jgi:hypothetical protein|nr:hypothetical protein [Candidatus Acetothermia bacterium]MDH7505688.1 hypothetical protein [Candidatus Acetothermia bacterium]